VGVHRLHPRGHRSEGYRGRLRRRRPTYSFWSIFYPGSAPVPSSLPACRHACRNVGAGLRSIPAWLPTILWFSARSRDLGFWNPACQSPLLGTGEPDANSDRHNPDHPLPPLHGGN
jgi:hypothetical protein